MVLQAEMLVKLDARLPAVLRGEDRPAEAELLDFAVCCRLKRFYAASARFFEKAFDADLKLADSSTRLRYIAATAAALAGCGQGKDSARLDDKERARLRRRALVWLRADLAHWTRHLDSGTPGARAQVQQVLLLWTKETALAGLREEAALAKLPLPERAACQKLWSEVQALLKKGKPDKP
jgi:hypothetical protein